MPGRKDFQGRKDFIHYSKTNEKKNISKTVLKVEWAGSTGIGRGETALGLLTSSKFSTLLNYFHYFVVGVLDDDLPRGFV